MKALINLLLKALMRMYTGDNRREEVIGTCKVESTTTATSLIFQKDKKPITGLLSF